MRLGQVYVAWKHKMLHDIIGGHQAIWRIDFAAG